VKHKLASLFSVPFQDFFSSRAAMYTRFRPDYPAELIDFVASLAHGHRLAWDCGTGNGQAAVALAAHFDRVIATDASAAQIARARTHERVEYRVVRAETSGLADHTVDLVTVAQALHWFDRAAFFDEARRVLVSGGAITVWTYGDPTIDEPAVDRLLQRFNHETMASYWPAERGVVGAAYAAMAFPFAEVPAPRYTLERTWTLGELGGYLRSWSAVTRYRTTHDDDPVAAFEAELARVWGDSERRHIVQWPITVRAGRSPYGKTS